MIYTKWNSAFYFFFSFDQQQSANKWNNKNCNIFNLAEKLYVPMQKVIDLEIQTKNVQMLGLWGGWGDHVLVFFMPFSYRAYVQFCQTIQHTSYETTNGRGKNVNMKRSTCESRSMHSHKTWEQKYHVYFGSFLLSLLFKCRL